MSADFIVFAVVAVCLLYWIGTNVHAIAKHGEPARDPDDRPLTWREQWILSKRPDRASATDEERLAWHEKYKDKIDTKGSNAAAFRPPYAGLTRGPERRGAVTLCTGCIRDPAVCFRSAGSAGYQRSPA
jgi:hypothetical protein